MPVELLENSTTAVAVERILKSMPTSTVHQSRLQLYQPTRRPTWLERVIVTPWGTATVRGKIGQVHADIIEAMCRHAEDYRVIPITGQLQLLVDPYRVRVTVGGGSAYSQDTLWRMLTELREVSITLEAPAQGLKVLGGILERVEDSPATKLNHFNGKQRKLWRVTLDPAFAAMLRDDLQLHYDPLPLTKIETGIAQAIARHILTHRDQPEGGWLIDNLIKVVGADESGGGLRNRRREIHKSVESLRAVGLQVEGDRIFRIDSKA